MTMGSRHVLVVCLGAAALLVAGCANKAVAPPAQSPGPGVATTPPAARAPATASGYGSASLGVSADLMRQCNLQLHDVAKAPKFGFDESALQPQDRDVLAQVAKCVTTGPLRGRALALVGRTDPRGAVEYNFVLGEHRAASVESYLAALGVDKNKLRETSRGELDATGRDEATWQQDRRVDIELQ